MMTNHGNRVTQGQFSYLPDLTDAQISKQIEYALKNNYAVGVKYTDDRTRATRIGRCSATRCST